MGQLTEEMKQLTAELEELRQEMITKFATLSHTQMKNLCERALAITKRIAQLTNKES